MTNANTTAPPACASQAGAHPPIALTADAGAQTGRPVITAVAAGYPGASPEYVTVTIDGVAHHVDVTVDRDDWQVPDVADGHEHAVMGAIDDAVEKWHQDNAPEASALHRQWARSAA